MAIRNVYVSLVGGHTVDLSCESGSAFMESYLEAHHRGADGLIMVEYFEPTSQVLTKHFINTEAIVSILTEEVD